MAGEQIGGDLDENAGALPLTIFVPLPAKLLKPFAEKLQTWIVETNAALVNARTGTVPVDPQQVSTVCQPYKLCATLADRLRDIPTPDDSDDPDMKALSEKVQQLSAELSSWMKSHPDDLAKVVTGVILSAELGFTSSPDDGTVWRVPSIRDIRLATGPRRSEQAQSSAVSGSAACSSSTTARTRSPMGRVFARVGMRDETMLVLRLKWATARPIRSARDVVRFLHPDAVHSLR